MTDSDTGRRNNGDDKVALKLFVEDFNSRFWFTYRKGYQRLNGNIFYTEFFKRLSHYL